MDTLTAPPPIAKAFEPRAHPVLPLPDEAQVAAILAGPDGEAELYRVYMEREELIDLEVDDPLRYSFELESWRRADRVLGWDEWLKLPRGHTPLGDVIDEILALGGNRAAKTEWMIKRALQLMVKRPKSRVLILHDTEKTSIRDHHQIAFKYIPKEWKNLPKSRVTNISYQQKTGFAENTFVFPNGSQCFFGNYHQDITTIEGGEYDLIIGDELIPLNWVETLRYRLVTRAGKFMIGFTPKEGYTATVKALLTGKRTLEEVDAELLPKRNRAGETIGYKKVPLVEAGSRKNRAIVYFHSKGNPYGGYENLVRQLDGASEEEILVRAYGVPTRRMANRFPKFRAGVHTFKFSQLPERGTRFHLVDPCGGRSWFQIWALVTEDPIGKRLWIYRESPCEGVYIPGVGDPGPWAIPGEKEDGDRGKAQEALRGWGLKRYAAEIGRMEGWPEARLQELEEEEYDPWGGRRRKRRKSRLPGVQLEVGGEVAGAREKVFTRWMDSRFGNAPTIWQDETRTLIECCQDVGLYFEPASGRQGDFDGENWVTLINNLLDYEEGQPLDPLNCPRLMVCEECTAVIYGLENWTGVDGKEGACKDPIDVVKYLVLGETDDYEGQPVAARSGGYRR